LLRRADVEREAESRLLLVPERG